MARSLENASNVKEVTVAAMLLTNTTLTLD